MIPPATPTPEVVDVKRLDHLPLVGAMLRELAIKDTLDALIPRHERNAVTVGECIEALVLTILTGAHALSRVAETLAGYDLEVIFQRPMEAVHFHDNRLGRVLDALWTMGLDRVYGAVISQAIRRYALELTQLHTDTTSLKVYGAYERDAAEEGPLVTFGYSRDQRPDLKQLLFGLTVTADGIPVWGHVGDGNCSDSTEHPYRPAAPAPARLRRTAPGGRQQILCGRDDGSGGGAPLPLRHLGATDSGAATGGGGWLRAGDLALAVGTTWPP
jgi:hypothetical protein